MPTEKQHPHDLKAGMDHLRQLFRDGQDDRLIAEARALGVRFPDHPQPARLLARALARQHRHDEAQQALAQARANGLADAPWLSTRLLLAHETRDWADIVATTEALDALDRAEGKPPLARFDAHALRQYCNALIDLGQAEKASNLIDRLEAQQPGGAWKTQAKFRALAALHDFDTIAPECEAWLTAPGATPDRGIILRSLGQHVPELRDKALAILERLYRAQPDSPLVQTALNATGTEPDGKGGIVFRAASLRHAVRQAGSARAGLEQLLSAYASEKRQEPAPLLDRLNADLAGQDLCRPLIDDDPDAEVLISPPGDSGQVALIFNGMGHGFGIPNGLLDAYFAQRGISTIFLRDFDKTLCFAGIRSLGAGFQATVRALRDLIGERSGDALTVYGNSGGGIAALRFGAALGAGRIVGTAAATSATAEFVARTGDTRGQLLTRRLYGMFDQSDLCGRTALLAAPGKPRVDLLFGDLSQVDHLHADELRDLDNVHIYRIPEFALHATVFELFRRGLLGDLIDGRLGGNQGLLQG